MSTTPSNEPVSPHEQDQIDISTHEDTADTLITDLEQGEEENVETDDVYAEALQTENNHQDPSEKDENQEIGPKQEPEFEVTKNVEQKNVEETFGVSQESTVAVPSLPTPLTHISWKDAAKQNELKASVGPLASFVDKAMLDQVEVNAVQSSSNLIVLVHHLRTQLQNMSSLSVQYMKLHKLSMEGVVEEVEGGIESMKELIEKCVDLNEELKKARSIHEDIKGTKKMLSILEKQVDRVVKPK